MKRGLLAIPVASAVIGGLLLLWHRTVERPPDASRSAAPPGSHEEPPKWPLPPPGDPRPATVPGPPVSAAGSVRVHVHARGQAVGGAKVDLGPVTGARAMTLETAAD